MNGQDPPVFALPYLERPWIVLSLGKKYPEVDRFPTREAAVEGAKAWLLERRDAYGSDYTECVVVHVEGFVRLQTAPVFDVLDAGGGR